ncbi:helix-turn-helix domain-containing protein [Paenibacillus apiarius]|uniref:Helix-turn-helix domain-containing protein n=1 Tax=Paenibacillus apiarius TaxID=46240 RepID=A0ABT4DRN7_9BACL|nr:helix-turn-helix domain-containing protein [Paenibacillus apiarius]MCY9515283.1 helix-turn-helix domain-containing protein [Paenibacillus apiarius]MCY9520032.1 helix-turn-helix domain-containing protein [Paenibacillus apiarius]MCY9554345.1 helix-turn-helix domain-containing protein [Paenibacillus apiarius]MCY9558136.1 helix-turn-helix domain-containing protein [Paenibacillus apiarius]MCY9684931.1 helix-turn-helix domain-containing protein [Paenibacillus apiarius]
MRWNHFKSKLLFKYILSYLSIFLVPLIIMTVIIYENAVSNLRSEIEQSGISHLEQAKLNIDGRMAELSDIAARISFDGKLTPYMVRHFYYSGEAIEALDKYKANSSIINELFLYFRGDDIIYSSRGLMSIDTLVDHSFPFMNWNKETFVKDLNSVHIPTLRPSDSVAVNNQYGKDRLLAYLVPIPPNQTYSHGTVLYFIEESMLTGLMDSVLGNFKGNAYIFDMDGHALAATSRGDEMTEADMAKLASMPPGIHSATFGNVDHSVVAVKSEANGWTYVTAMPSEQFFGRVVHIQTFIFLIFGVVLIFGSILAVQLARRQYHPIRDLMEFAKLKTNPDNVLPSGKSELEWIRETLLSYRNQVDLQEPYARNQCLLTLLKHGASSRQEAEDMLRMIGVSMPGNRWFVIIVAWDYSEVLPLSTRNRGTLLQKLAELQRSDAQAAVYGVELSQPDQLALIVSLPADEAEKEQFRMEAVVEELQRAVLEHAQVVPTMGVGGCHAGPEHVNQSYIEAASALEYRIVNGKGSVTFFTHLSHERDHHFWIAKDSLIKLAQSLKQGNANVAVATIGALFSRLHSQDMPIALLRCMCFDLLNTVLKAASELGLAEMAQRVPDLAGFETLEQLEAKLCELALYICGQVEQLQETEQRSLADEVIAYIEQHYTDYELSLERLAGIYRVSVSYLSRSIKEKSGRTFSQYVWQLRMDDVVHQLKSGDEPLKDIILRVGYLDVPNFIRKFKKETGYTPGQYRKLYGAGEASADLDEDGMKTIV